MNKPLSFVICLALILLPAAANAQRVQDLPAVRATTAKKHPQAQPQAQPPAPPASLRDRIAAVVNDGIITTDDINQRMKLAMLSSGLPPTPDVEEHLLPQILRNLIDEQLQLQEAKRLDIKVSKEDIDAALARVAKENHIEGDLRDYTTAHGVSVAALEQQIRGGVAWSKVVQRELRPNVEVGDDEVDTAIQRMKADAGKEEYLVSEIFLSVDNPKDEEQIRQVADNLVQQIKGGANFAAVARQFSQSTGAASGGDIGWIQQGQLSPELNHALTGMDKGGIAGPIRTPNGYHVLSLRDKRTMTAGNQNQNPDDVTVDLQQAFRPFDGSDREAALKEAGQLRSTISGCGNLQEKLTQKFPAWHWQSLGTVKQNKVPAWLAEKVDGTTAGKGSEPITTNKGALVVFVCERHMPTGNIDRDAIMNSIGTEKLELQARRLMRDLRRQAYLDIRLGSS